jgi:hypothetical protein
MFEEVPVCTEQLTVTSIAKTPAPRASHRMSDYGVPSELCLRSRCNGDGQIPRVLPVMLIVTVSD